MMFKIKILNFYKRFNIYLVNTSWIVVDKILNMGLIFLVTILVARYLGPAKFGVLAYAISILALFASFGHVGLRSIVIHELTKYPKSKHEIMGTSLILIIFGYLIGLILMLLFSLTTESIQSEQFWVLVILASTLLFRPLHIIDLWFQSRLEAKYTTIAFTSATFMASIIKIVLVFSGANLILFASANVVQVILATAILIFLYQYKSKLNLINWYFSYDMMRNLLPRSWKSYIGSIFAVIYLKIDQVMLKWIVGTEEVGVYAIAASLSEVWYFIPVAIVSSFFPKLIKLKKNNPILFNKRLQQIFDLLFIIAFGVAIVVTLISKPLIIIMFGEVYQNAASILMIHIWAALFIFMRALFSRWIVIEDVLIFSMITHGSGALLNIVLNYILIPQYGGEGAAYATLFSYATSSYFALLLYFKTRPIFWMMTKSLFSPLRYCFDILRGKI